MKNAYIGRVNKVWNNFGIYDAMDLAVGYVIAGKLPATCRIGGYFALINGHPYEGTDSDHGLCIRSMVTRMTYSVNEFTDEAKDIAQSIAERYVSDMKQHTEDYEDYLDYVADGYNYIYIDKETSAALQFCDTVASKIN